MVTLQKEYLSTSDFKTMFGPHEKLKFLDPRPTSQLPQKYYLVKQKSILIFSKEEMFEILGAYLKIPVWRVDSVNLTYKEIYKTLWEPNEISKIEVRWHDRQPTWFERWFKGYK